MFQSRLYWRGVCDLRRSVKQVNTTMLVPRGRPETLALALS
jgi:hypothetical protein